MSWRRVKAVLCLVLCAQRGCFHVRFANSNPAGYTGTMEPLYEEPKMLRLRMSYPRWQDIMDDGSCHLPLTYEHHALHLQKSLEDSWKSGSNLNIIEIAWSGSNMVFEFLWLRSSFWLPISIFCCPLSRVGSFINFLPNHRNFMGEI